MGMRSFVVAAILGGGLAYFLDPKSGSQRRGKVTGRFGSSSSFPGSSDGWSSSSTATSSSGSSTGSSSPTSTAAGPTGGPANTASGSHDNVDPDDNTLRDRIESEIFRDEETSREHINISVIGGVVEIRGEQPTQADIDALIQRVRGIRDVLGVHSYLHLPGTDAPNKAEVIQASEDAARS